MAKEALIVFQKNIVKGKVKTRLAQSLGEEKTLQIYQFLVDKTFREVNKITPEVYVFFSDFLPGNHFEPKHHLRIQKGEDLGEKMKLAFEEVFALGYNRAVIIGTDCPEITAEILNQAFDLLDRTDLVVGPAKDGGYYLLGMKTNHFFLFREIPWSTSHVFSRTLEKAESNGLNYSILPKLSDIDREEDWNKFITQNPKYE